VTIKSGTGACLFCFSPAAVTIPAGASVTFTNTSGADHTVARCTPSACNGESGGTGTDSAFSQATVAVPAGQSFSYTFTQPGTYVYYCTIHGYALMHGTITVAAASTTTTAAAAPVTTPSDAGAPVVETVNPLASTGSSSEPLVLVGIVALLTGVAAVAIGSRRRTHH
jgi:LPXTG-motif cell wall-anchored protein